MLILLGIILGLGVGAISVYFVLRPRMKVAQELDQETIRKNGELQEENAALHAEVYAMTARRDEIGASLQQMMENNRQSANAVYESCMNEMQEKLATNAQAIGDKYRQDEIDAQSEYLDTLHELMMSFQQDIQTKRLELSEVESVLANMQSLTNAAVEANKRAHEMAEKANFYRLVLSEEDVREIERLREVTPYLRDSEPLNKVIWKVYYENPYTDMIGRVVGKGVHTGIYKITNLENGMCYIGQAANIADRWKQHIKRGIGAETPTRNKLYPAMLAIGVENFTFEIVEECDRTKLNEREDYWQDYFKAKEFGYSIK
jgi:hypothetical protein